MTSKPTDLRRLRNLLELLKEHGVRSFKDGSIEIDLGTVEPEWTMSQPDEERQEYEIPFLE